MFVRNRNQYIDKNSNNNNNNNNNDNNRDCLQLAVESGDFEFLQTWFRICTEYKVNIRNINTTTSKNNNLFAAPITQNHLKIVKILLESGIFDVNNVIEIGNGNDQTTVTPLSLCCSSENYTVDNFECFKLLLSQDNINVNIPDGNGVSPFLHCVITDKLEFVEYFINCRNDLKDDPKALCFAAHHCSYKVLNYLLTLKKFNTNCVSEALAECCEIIVKKKKKKKENFNCFQLLLKQKGIDVNYILDKHRNISPFMRCCMNDKLEFIEYFIKCQNDIDHGMQSNLEWQSPLTDIKSQTSKYDKNVLYCAARNGSKKVFEYLLKQKIFDENDETTASEIYDKQKHQSEIAKRFIEIEIKHKNSENSEWTTLIINGSIVGNVIIGKGDHDNQNWNRSGSYEVSGRLLTDCENKTNDNDNSLNSFLMQIKYTNDTAVLYQGNINYDSDEINIIGAYKSIMSKDNSGMFKVSYSYFEDAAKDYKLDYQGNSTEIKAKYCKEDKWYPFDFDCIVNDYGIMAGCAKDNIGDFIIEGSINVSENTIYFQKKYIGKHTGLCQILFVLCNCVRELAKC